MKKMNQVNVSLEEFEQAQADWKSVKGIGSMLDIEKCVTLHKTMSQYLVEQHLLTPNSKRPDLRQSKYCKVHYVRVLFTNKATHFFTDFPKKMGLKNRKIGTLPQMDFELAKAKAIELTNTNRDYDVSPLAAFDAYEKDLELRVSAGSLKRNSANTYISRINILRPYFSETQRFSELSLTSLVKIIDQIIEDFDGKAYVRELVDELKRVWDVASQQFNDGENHLSGLSKKYVINKTKKPLPSKAHTDRKSIAELFVNMGMAPSVNQKNAVRYMILQGVRPINVCNVKLEYIDCLESPSKITYPDGIYEGEEADMKNGEEFVMPVTDTLRELLLDQIKWHNDNFFNFKSEWLFVQPSDPTKPFSKRSLDKLVKDYSPINCIKGKISADAVKGKSGAFNTMCRKHLKTNVKSLVYLASNKTDLSRATLISKLVMHHSVNATDGESSELKDFMDNLKQHYDFSEEEYGFEFLLKLEGFKLHHQSILDDIDTLKDTGLRETGRQAKDRMRKAENDEKQQLRSEIMKIFGKPDYAKFINSVLPGATRVVKDIIHTEQGRKLIRNFLDLGDKQAA
ncbi:hypothetical protein [Pseudoalteromonas atlantica]|uniref:hypothetical protein n=1 Tax=Pseudoalteromonas atlantica TaxID=288 RepID=UPI0037369760